MILPFSQGFRDVTEFQRLMLTIAAMLWYGIPLWRRPQEERA